MAVEWIKSQEGHSLSKSALKILEILEHTKEVSATDLREQLNCSTRTIHYALKILMEKKIIEKKPFLLDMRQTRYIISQQLLSKAQNDTNYLVKELTLNGRLV